MKFKIKYGLGSGFGGANNEEIIDVGSLEEAEQWAYESACEEYDSYAGMYGLRDVEQIIEEDEVSEDDAIDIYGSEREDWLDYSAEPYSEDEETKTN